MLLIFRRSYLGCWGGDGWGLPIVVNVLCSSGSKWLNHWTKKRKWNVPWVSQWLFFFSKKYRKVGLYILKVPHCGLGQNILKDEVTEVKMKSLHYVGLTAICHHWVKYICVQASKAQKSSWDDGFELLSLSAFKFQILKANPFVGQGYPGYMSRVSSPALISDSTISAPDEQCVCERESGSVCVDSISSLKNWLSVF